jgi:hypothetical protein
VVDQGQYQIQVRGWISERWRDWFDEMAITRDQTSEGVHITTLTGIVSDQAALLGLLQKLYTLGFPLLLVKRKEVDGMSETAHD